MVRKKLKLKTIIIDIWKWSHAMRCDDNNDNKIIN